MNSPRPKTTLALFGKRREPGIAILKEIEAEYGKLG